MNNTDNIIDSNIEDRIAIEKEEELIRQIKMNTIAEYNSLGVRESASKSKIVILLVILLIMIVAFAINSYIEYRNTMNLYEDKGKEYNIDDDNNIYIELE